MEKKSMHSSLLHHCHHTYFIKNKCIECGKPRSTIKSRDQATLPFGYIQPNLTLTLQEIRGRRNENLQSLISRRKLHLVLDLDQTLVHSTTTHYNVFVASQGETEHIMAMDDTYEILDGMYMVKLRPGAREFVKQVSSMFDLSVYTLSHKIYAKEVVKLLENTEEEGSTSSFSWVITKEDCLKNKQKGLDIVLSHEKVVLIVDDSKTVWKESGSKNLINISPYYFFVNREKTKEMDKELARVLSILKEVHSAFYDDNLWHDDKVDYTKRDVRKVLHRVLSKHKKEQHQNPLYRILRKFCIE